MADGVHGPVIPGLVPVLPDMVMESRRNMWQGLMCHLHVAEPGVRDMGSIKVGDEPVPDPGVAVPAVHEDDGDGTACHGIKVGLSIR
jgi:hypothetical protein